MAPSPTRGSAAGTGRGGGAPPSRGTPRGPPFARVMFPRPAPPRSLGSPASTGHGPPRSTLSPAHRNTSYAPTNTPPPRFAVPPVSQPGSAPPTATLGSPQARRPLVASPAQGTSRGFEGLPLGTPGSHLQRFRLAATQCLPRNASVTPAQGSMSSAGFPGTAQANNNSARGTPPVSANRNSSPASVASPQRWNIDAPLFTPRVVAQLGSGNDNDRSPSPILPVFSSTSNGAPAVPPPLRGGRLNSTLIDEDEDPDRTMPMDVPMDVEEEAEGGNGNGNGSPPAAPVAAVNNNNQGNPAPNGNGPRRSPRLQTVAPTLAAGARTGAPGRIRKNKAPKRITSTQGGGGRGGSSSSTAARALAQNVDVTCSKAAFKRVVHEILGEHLHGVGANRRPYKMQAGAVEILQATAEEHLTTLFSMSDILARHAHRVTIKLEDWQLAQQFYEMDRPKPASDGDPAAVEVSGSRTGKGRSAR